MLVLVKSCPPTKKYPYKYAQHAYQHWCRPQSQSRANSTCSRHLGVDNNMHASI